MDQLIARKTNEVCAKRKLGQVSDSDMIEFLLDTLDHSKVTDEEEQFDIHRAYFPKEFQKTGTRKRQKLAVAKNLACQLCGSMDEKALDSSYVETCTHCGLVVNDLRFGPMSFSKSLKHNFNKISQPYHRQIYWNEKLKQRQGISRVVIPQHVVMIIVGDYFGKKLLSTLTIDDIQKSLRKHDYNYLQEHSTKILGIVNTSYKPFIWNEGLTWFFTKHFMKIVRAFEWCKKNIGPHYFFYRKSMLPTDFCCWKICEELKLHPWYKGLWKISKNKLKLLEQTIIYERIQPFINTAIY